MQKIVIFALAFLALASAAPPNDQRETKWKVQDPGILKLQHREKVFENANHRVDATGQVQKNFVNKDAPTLLGGRVDYQNKPSNTGLGVEAVNAGRFGTQVGVEASRNFFKDKNSAWDAGVSYGQRFGGLGGRSEPVFGGFVRGRF
ncbi:uncharacterized protein LOC100141947 [Tribolium castaneum]|uniref:Uncharacterized protein n=1 Tax=Tribolium castaneum TaxID=7070 RepID=D2A1G9_TRICA|nr:PREDICTED: uncharacterized protein LOC100141947 [Tribolium castaneum]EFA02855.1 hypothetical protein TcasGA2_TC007738 [Tribolium castaneum]|eukprot:XP_001809637.1 PREDICTED: uncharacterized protein LOC100141947 [Tribolium castaneum]